MNEFDVSVIIPMYNSESTINNTIQSIIDARNETKLRVEIILVDDGSIDNTKNVSKGIMNTYENIFYYYQKNNKQGSARNVGIQKSNAKYISFIDSDDIIMDDYFFPLEKHINKEYDIITFGMMNIDNKGNILNKIIVSGDINQYLETSDPRMLIVPASPVLAFYNSKYINDNNIRFLEGIQFEDIHFSILTYLYAKSVKRVEKFSYLYKEREGSTVKSSNPLNNLDLFKISNILKEYFKKFENYNEVLNYILILHVFLGGSIRVIESSLKLDKRNNVLTDFSEYLNQEHPNWKYNNFLNIKQKILIKLILHKQYLIVRIIRNFNHIKIKILSGRTL